MATVSPNTGENYSDALVPMLGRNRSESRLLLRKTSGLTKSPKKSTLICYLLKLQVPSSLSLKCLEIACCELSEGLPQRKCAAFVAHSHFVQSSFLRSESVRPCAGRRIHIMHKTIIAAL